MSLYTPQKFTRPAQSGTPSIATYTSTLTSPNGSNIATVISDLDALTYTDLGDYQEFNIIGRRDNEKEFTSDLCGVGTYAKTFDEREDVSFNWLDSANLDLYQDFMNVFYETTLTEKIVSKNFEAVEAKFVVLKFVACDLNGYDIAYAEDPTKKIVDTHYVVKASLSSDFEKQYAAIGNDQDFAGTAVEFTGEKGGFYVFKRQEFVI